MSATIPPPTRSHRLVFFAICTVIAVFSWFWYGSLVAKQTHVKAVPPDFSSIDDSQSRKQSFIEFLYPLIVEENRRLLQKRSQLLVLQNQLQQSAALNSEQSLWLERLAARYAVAYVADDPMSVIDALLKRLNVIPPSLVIAQAANETAWGTSRFAIEANNYFGQWCYSEGCGLVPLARNEGARHEVKSFASVSDSVSAYLHTLNSGRAYAGLRHLRQQLEAEQGRLSGIELASGLGKYSERGADYVDSIQQLIRSNNLGSYTEAFYATLQETDFVNTLDQSFD